MRIDDKLKTSPKNYELKRTDDLKIQYFDVINENKTVIKKAKDDILRAEIDIKVARKLLMCLENK